MPRNYNTDFREQVAEVATEWLAVEPTTQKQQDLKDEVLAGCRLHLYHNWEQQRSNKSLLYRALMGEVPVNRVVKETSLKPRRNKNAPRTRVAYNAPDVPAVPVDLATIGQFFSDDELE